MTAGGGALPRMRGSMTSPLGSRRTHSPAKARAGTHDGVLVVSGLTTGGAVRGPVPRPGARATGGHTGAVRPSGDVGVRGHRGLHGFVLGREVVRLRPVGGGVTDLTEGRRPPDGGVQPGRAPWPRRRRQSVPSGWTARRGQVEPPGAGHVAGHRRVPGDVASSGDDALTPAVRPVLAGLQTVVPVLCHDDGGTAAAGGAAHRSSVTGTLRFPHRSRWAPLVVDGPVRRPVAGP